MDERVRLFAWIAGSGGLFGLLGAGFGALTGLLYWRGGRAAGTGVGLRVARAFERTGGQALSPASRGAIVGAVDGFLFLAVVGGLFGAIAGHGRFQGAATTAIAMGGSAPDCRCLVLWRTGLCGLGRGLTRRGRPVLRSRGGRRSWFLAGPATGLLIGVIGGAALGLVGLLLTRSLTRLGSPSPPLIPQTADPQLKALSDDIQENRPEDTW